jgi:hypothetical protein
VTRRVPVTRLGGSAELPSIRRPCAARPSGSPGRS